MVQIVDFLPQANDKQASIIKCMQAYAKYIFIAHLYDFIISGIVSIVSK